MEPSSRDHSDVLDLVLDLERGERLRRLQYEVLRKEVEKGYRENPRFAALAARMFRGLEISIQKPHNFQDENSRATFSGHGFGEYILDQFRVQDPNLAGSADLHFQQQKMSDTAEVRIEIPDDDDYYIPDHASNSSTFGQVAAFSLYGNHQKPSNGEVTIEILDEDDGLTGIPYMPNFGSGATNFAVASSSGIDKFACDDSETSNMAQGVPSGPYPNQPKGATVSEIHNHDKDDPALTMNSNVSAYETGFRPDVNTIVAAVAGQAIVNLISSSSTDSSSVRLFAAASGIGFLGSFFAMYFFKRPKLAKVLSKIGAIGTASGVIIALGINILRDTNWYLRVGGRFATAAACLISAMVVLMADTKKIIFRDNCLVTNKPSVKKT